MKRMRKFLRLTDVIDSEGIYINPEHVVAVYKAYIDSTSEEISTIETVDGDTYHVRESAERVVSLCEQ